MLAFGFRFAPWGASLPSPLILVCLKIAFMRVSACSAERGDSRRSRGGKATPCQALLLLLLS